MNVTELLALYEDGERDFQELNLENINLSLSGTDLSDANLSSANFSNTNLSHANLSNADLCDANLINTDLSHADLSDADLRDADLRGADLCGADLSDADLCGANLINADLSGADLCGADLSGADLNSVTLTGAIIDGETKLHYKWYCVWRLVNTFSNSNVIDVNSIYDDSDLENHDIELLLNGIDLTFNSINLHSADLSFTKLKNTNLSGADLSGADLSNTDLSGANLRGTNLINADLSGAKLNLVNLNFTIINDKTKIDDKWYLVGKITNGKLDSGREKDHQLSLSFDSVEQFEHNHDIGDCVCRDLSHSCLQNLNLSGINLSFSILYRSDCKNTNLSNASLYSTNFYAANLSGADLRYSILTEANLQGADLSNSDLRYANLHEAQLEKAKTTEGAKLLPSDISCSWNKLNDDQFEQLCYDILRERHKPIEINKMGKSRSRDGNRDIVFDKSIGGVKLKWIAQCKLITNRGSLTLQKVQNIRDTLDRYKAKGFCIITSGIIDATLHDMLDALKDNLGFEIERLSYLEIERFLAENPEIRARYFRD